MDASNRITKKALVLGNDSRIFLSVIRSLGRAGIQVQVASHQLDSVALRSRYVHKAHAIPAFDDLNSAWRSALCSLMEREKFDLVIPCTELATIACQRNRAELEQLGKVYLISDEAFEILFDKFKTNALARSVGVRTPREIIVTQLDQAQRILSQFDWPVVLKPPRTSNPAAPDVLHLVRKAYTKEELDQILSMMLKAGAIAAQENFIGEGVGVELLLKDGEPLLEFQHVRLHEPLHGGPSSYRKGVTVSPELLEAALKILRPLAYTGVAMVEFKVNPKTGDWVFIEVNARFWGSLPLAVASGVDFPLALFQMLVEGRDSFPRKYLTGICSRNWERDMEWQRANLSADHSDPTLATRPLWKVLGDLCLNLITLRERNDVFTLDDPVPGLVESQALARRFLGRLFTR